MLRDSLVPDDILNELSNIHPVGLPNKSDATMQIDNRAVSSVLIPFVRRLIMNRKAEKRLICGRR